MLALPHLPDQRPHADVGADVAKAVRAYAHRIGCNASDTQAAIAFALRTSNCLFTAAQAGRRRADQLRERAHQQQVPA